MSTAAAAAVVSTQRKRKLDLAAIPMLQVPKQAVPASPNQQTQETSWQTLLARAKAEQRDSGGLAMLTDTFRLVHVNDDA